MRFSIHTFYNSNVGQLLSFGQVILQKTVSLARDVLELDQELNVFWHHTELRRALLGMNFLNL